VNLLANQRARDSFTVSERGGSGHSKVYRPRRQHDWGLISALHEISERVRRAIQTKERPKYAGLNSCHSVNRSVDRWVSASRGSRLLESHSQLLRLISAPAYHRRETRKLRRSCAISVVTAAYIILLVVRHPGASLPSIRGRHNLTDFALLLPGCLHLHSRPPSATIHMVPPRRSF